LKKGGGLHIGCGFNLGRHLLQVGDEIFEVRISPWLLCEREMMRAKDLEVNAIPGRK
jgi:hypothetical protein